MPQKPKTHETTSEEYARFVASCQKGNQYALTPEGNPSPYALCFAIFGWNLLKRKDVLTENRLQWNKTLRDNLNASRDHRLTHGVDLSRDKPYLQLLTFTLSSLSILGTLPQAPLEDHVEALLPRNLEKELKEAGVFRGRPRSGNHAMFIAIFLCHAGLYLGRNRTAQLEEWVELHRTERNSFGFWGIAKGMTHLQFQNGYHQYEILEYLDIDDWDWELASRSTAYLADKHGHFAPYPGGGGCYDYDALFILSSTAKSTQTHSDLLQLCETTIKREQNPDGGFCESHLVRPNGRRKWKTVVSHVLQARGPALRERLRICLNLQRSKHNMVRNHWTNQPYGWSSSDLWNSWFRMMAIARIQIALVPEKIENWGFIDYPGIGYHHMLGKKEI